MALTRKMLRAMGIEDEKIDQIIEAHTETVDGLKAERDENKSAKEQADTLTAQVESLKKQLEASGNKGDDGAAEKYAELEKEFEAYKSQIEGEKAHALKAKLYGDLLEANGIDPKRRNKIVQVTDVDALAVEDGKLVDAEKLGEDAKAEWSEFILKQKTSGAEVATPPTGGGEKTYTMDEIKNMSAKEINANWDAVKRALATKE